ncbi:MAG: gluconate 2-dehydrogenase subunit 3 family protein [Bryobacterales bacterium]|nr:gluconate 2-dehydrogenase subunit 3 family protein [Bryobacterales bacterium]
MEERRDALKIIGAIGTTCAFPFSADELYGQHDHGSAMAPPAVAAKPAFFNQTEFATVIALADTIVPATDTPSASQAGVPAYIDFVVNSNANWKRLFREGLAWLDTHCNVKYGKAFRELSEAHRETIAAPLCKAADAIRPALQPGRNARTRPDPMRNQPMEVRFFKAFKSMTADGYFTGKEGLVDTLGYRGNTVLGEFPSCEHEH